MHNQLHVLRHQGDLPSIGDQSLIARRGLREQDVNNLSPRRRKLAPHQIRHKAIVKRLLDLAVSVYEQLNREAATSYGFPPRHSLEYL